MKAWKNRSLKDLTIKKNGIVYNEEWKGIEYFEGLYMISSFGRVKSLERVKSIIRKGYPVDLFIKERILGQYLDGGGYPGVKITKDCRVSWFHTHRLVGKYFIPNPNSLKEINHLYGDKENNFYLDLEWSTKSDNIKHAFKTGLSRSKFQNFGKDNPKSKPVSQYSIDGIFIKTFAGQAEAERETGADQGVIWRVCNGLGNTAGGFKWKYAKGFGLGRRGGNIYEIKDKK